MILKGVLFDLDNTLVDRQASIEKLVMRFANDFADRLSHNSVRCCRIPYWLYIQNSCQE